VSLFREPLLLVIGFFTLFLLAIVFARVDLRINPQAVVAPVVVAKAGKTTQRQSKKKL